MSVRVDQRDVVTRAQDVILAAEFENDHPGIELERCECGAARLTFLNPTDADPVCAGCLLTPTYKLAPAPHSAQRDETVEVTEPSDSVTSTRDFSGLAFLLSVPAFWGAVALAVVLVTS